MKKLIFILFPLVLVGQNLTNNIVMTQNQMDNLNTRLGSSDGENSGQKYYSINNGFYNYGEWYWDIMNEIEPLLSSGSMPGAYDYGHERNQAVVLGQPGGDDDTYAEPNSKTWLCHQNEVNFLDCIRSRNGYATGRQEPIYMNILSVIAATWEGRSENATINGTTRTKNEWSELFANFVFDELVKRSADDKLDFKNGAATYTTNATFGTTAKYPQSGSNGGYVESEPNYEMIGQLKRFVISLSLIRSQISDDSVISESSEAGGGTKLQQVDEWLQGAGDYVYYWFEQEMDIWWTSSWRTQSNLNNGINALSPASSSQSAVYYTSSNTPVNTINQLQTLTMSNRHWATYGFLHALGTYYNNSTWKDDTETVFEMYFKMEIFSDGSFAEWYRSYAGCAACGMNYFIVTMWEVVDFAFVHAVAVTNGVAGVSDAGKYFNYTTSEGSDEVVQNWSTTSTSGGTKGIENTLVEISKYFRTPANGGYLGNRYVIGGSILQDPTDYRYGQIAALANTWYDNSDLTDFAEMSTSAGYPGQGYFGDGNGTTNIPNWELPLSGPFGSWRAAIDYQEQTDIFSAPAQTLAAFPSATGGGKNTTGGRSGSLYRVTTLSGTGAGSLADAVTQSDVMIVFEVGGICTEPLNFSGSNITIEGGTAPSRVEIQSTGESVVTGSNIIARNLMFHSNFTTTNSDTFRIGNGGTVSDIIFDHCSFTHATDETVSVYSDTGSVTKVTISNSIIGKNLSVGNGGFLMTGSSTEVSLFNNYFVLNSDRHAYSSDGDGSLEVVNNVFYGFQENFNISYSQDVDWIGNVLKATATAPQRNDILFYFRLLAGNTAGAQPSDGTYFLDDNLLVNNVESWALKDTDMETYDSGTKFFTNSNITPALSSTVENTVLNDVGAYASTSFGNGATDAALIAHYNATDGTFAGATPTDFDNPSGSSHSGSYDTDNDGISDIWEQSMFGDLSKSIATDTDSDGYNDLEEFFFYLNGEGDALSGSTINNKTTLRRYLR